MHTLFAPPNPELCRVLEALPDTLHTVLPLKSAHRRDLPLAVAELSARLTSERDAPISYWSVPRLTAAYLWYFLPWNLLRLTRLLQNLDMPAPVPISENTNVLPRIWADVGSGPLTLPIALWLARPEWRDVPLTVLCMDIAPHALEIGRRLFAAVAPNSCWRIVTQRAHADTLRRERARMPGLLWCVSAVNVCNEFKARAGEHVFQRLETFVRQVASILPQQADAHALFVEPGTRLGGKVVMAVRDAGLGYTPTGDDAEHEDTALHQGALLTPIHPCPHTGPCPLREGRSWCHFRLGVEGVPTWLANLSRAASLSKDDLNLAFVHMRAGAKGAKNGQSFDTKARVLSAPFIAQGVQGHARYACTGRGLVVLEKAQDAPQGALVQIVWSSTPQRDAKSGAWRAGWR